MSVTIAFIGLGNMGLPMARNLVKAGYTMIGFDLSSASRSEAETQGLQVAETATTAAAQADVVVTMLPAGRHVLSVWRDLGAAAKPNSLFIDCSTVEVESARQAHALLAGGGILTLDAPVSGGTGGAAAGTLTFMVGGSAAALAMAEPILKAMGKRIVHCGEAGAGQAAKICNNMILGISMTAVCEAFVLGEGLGLSHQALFDVASTSSGQCWSLSNYCPVPGPVPASPANNDYRPGFAVALMLKDLKLAQAAAAASGVHTPLGIEAARLYGRFEELGHGNEDFSAIIHLLRETGRGASLDGL